MILPLCLPEARADSDPIRPENHPMDQAIKTVMEVIIRLIAVALFITGLIFAREFLHEKFDPARFRGPQTYPRAALPASAIMLACQPSYSGEPYSMSFAKPEIAL